MGRAAADRLRKFIRKLSNTVPMSDHATGESTPGYTTLPADATDAQ
jgi:hypothetical protein